MPGIAIINLNNVQSKIARTELKIEHSRNLLLLYSQSTNLGFIGSQINANNIRIQEENLVILYKKLESLKNYREKYLKTNPDKDTYFKR